MRAVDDGTDKTVSPRSDASESARSDDGLLKIQVSISSSTYPTAWDDSWTRAGNSKRRSSRQIVVRLNPTRTVTSFILMIRLIYTPLANGCSETSPALHIRSIAFAPIAKAFSQSVIANLSGPMERARNVLRCWNRRRKSLI